MPPPNPARPNGGSKPPPYEDNEEICIYESARRKCPRGTTGIVRRIEDFGRVVIPKEIRRTMRIREGDPLLTTLTLEEKDT